MNLERKTNFSRAKVWASLSAFSLPYYWIWASWRLWPKHLWGQGNNVNLGHPCMVQGHSWWKGRGTDWLTPCSELNYGMIKIWGRAILRNCWLNLQLKTEFGRNLFNFLHETKRFLSRVVQTAKTSDRISAETLGLVKSHCPVP